MREKRGGLDLLIEQRGVAVLYAQAALGVHDLALVLHHLGIEGQIGDAIALEFEHQLERRAREPVLIDRDVLGSVGVVAAALRFQQPIELPLRAVGGAVEHHVFEEMRQSTGTGALVPAADPDPVVERHIRDVVVGPDDDLQSVGQGARLHLVGGTGEGSRCARSARECETRA